MTSQGKKLDEVLVYLKRATIIINFLQAVHKNTDWIIELLSNLSK